MTSSRVKRISKSIKRSCGYCKAYTVKNKPCKRLTACNIGCKYFCSQHAEQYGGSVTRKGKKIIKCISPTIEKCSCKDLSNIPCKRKLSFFFKEKDLKHYCENKPVRRSKGHRRKILHQYKSIWKTSRSKSRSRRKYKNARTNSRKIKFE